MNVEILPGSAAFAVFHLGAKTSGPGKHSMNIGRSTQNAFKLGTSS